MLQLRPDGTGEVVTLGPDIFRGMRLQTVVAGGVWQGSRLSAGGSFALMGTTMAPGFDFADYVAGQAAQLSAAYPQHAERIKRLTRA
jgi:predicted cupin superfamily sugar epimerase